MQAARGTPLTDGQPGDGSGDGSGDRVRPRRRWLLFGIVAVVAYVTDVVTKIVAVATIDPGERIEVLGPVLSLTMVRNPGAAFSTGTEFTIALSLLSIAVLVAVLWISRRIGSPLWAVGLGALAGGVGGNLTDRLLRSPGPLEGHVVDFLALPNWPVFNVADMLINVAAVTIVVQSLRGVRLDGTRDTGEDDA
ncbi:signal peptidase II [Nocardioidaceae bacterium]|nr:signal peptidase II [Nocardioidaceae bacterium]